MSKLAGYATPEGTHRFSARYEGNGQVATGHFRESSQSLSLSSLGMGTYLGNADAQTDKEMTQAAIDSLESGAINVLDTAINYRNQSSERSLGKALAELVEKGTIQRDEIFLCSKNGFLTPDAQVNQDFRTYFQKEFVETGIVTPDDIASDMHCMTPKYLEDQLNRSLSNLGVETLDLMYLHNASESQIPEVGREEFMSRLKAAFEFYESARKDNRTRFYGMATWNSFRVRPSQESDYLNLEDIVQLAESVGGKSDHGFRYIQLPYNFAMPEALILQNQTVNGVTMSLLEASVALGIGVFTSVPLLQGQLLRHKELPQFEGLNTPAELSLQFVRSTPGVIAPLVGHKQHAHVVENLKTASVPPLTPAEFEEMFTLQKAH